MKSAHGGLAPAVPRQAGNLHKGCENFGAALHALFRYLAVAGSENTPISNSTQQKPAVYSPITAPLRHASSFAPKHDKPVVLRPLEILNLVSGELVEVRSAQEILLTLDENGELDSLPFMPEMLQFCGQQFRVSRRADKTCDTIGDYHARRMYRTVHLEQLRCDGGGHDGCQAGCLIFWKEAWLKRAATQREGAPLVQIKTREQVNGEATTTDPELLDLLQRRARSTDEHGFKYACQATELLRASEPLPWWDFRQYLRDILTRNVSPGQFFRGCWYALEGIVRRRLKKPSGYPFVPGKLIKTPTERLDLQAGELVQVRSREEILATLDTSSKNRGLYYDIEMWRFSGGTFRVLRRVDHIVNEKNGRMINLPNGCVILDGVYCSGERSTHRLFCQRAIYSYWREIWLRRVE